LFLARFDRLALPQQIILQSASVIGYRFTTQILRQVLSAETEFSPAVIDESLHLLLEREFIIPQEGIEEEAENGNGAGEVNYQFRHVLVSDAVYSTLLQRDRRELHTRVGEVIENMYRDRLDGYIEVLAGHYLRSPYLDRALHYLTLAGEKAARSYANDQALQLFRQALEILPKVSSSAEQSMRVHSGLGDALLIAGDYTGGREQYVEAIESLGLPGRTGLLRYPPVKQDGMAMDRTSYLSLLSQLLRKIGNALENQGEYDRALAYIRSAQLVLLDEPVAFAVERGNCLNDTGWIFFRRGSLDEAEKVLNEGLQLAIPAGQLDLTASILNRLAGVYFQRNAVDQAANYMKRSLRIREEIGDVVAVARSYNNLGLIDWKQGALQAALDEFNRSYRLHENLGDIEGQIVLQTNMGLIELDLGNFSEARRRFQEALDNARQIGHSFHICMTQMHLALLNVYAENWPAVLEYGLLSLAGFQELGVKENLLDISVSLGWAYVGLSDDLHCREIEASILSMLSEGQGPDDTPPESHGRAYRLLSSLAGLRGDLEGATRAIERSVEIFSQAGSLLERSRSLVFLGKSLAAQGKMDLAMPLFYEARQVFQKMGARLELSRIDETPTRNSLKRSGDAWTFFSGKSPVIPF
jgi:tetratricopeptide (TPR) repeat protein